LELQNVFIHFGCSRFFQNIRQLARRRETESIRRSVKARTDILFDNSYQNVMKQVSFRKVPNRNKTTFGFNTAAFLELHPLGLEERDTESTHYGVKVVRAERQMIGKSDFKMSIQRPDRTARSAAAIISGVGSIRKRCREVNDFSDSEPAPPEPVATPRTEFQVD
jgi:hypothetical protein